MCLTALFKIETAAAILFQAFIFKAASRRRRFNIPSMIRSHIGPISFDTKQLR
jgi:hypothetical protein